MAKTQNDHVKVQEKNQDSHLQKASSLQSQTQLDQPGLSAQLTHAANFPEQAKPETIQLLQERYGNNEVRRIVQPQMSHEPVVDQSRTLDKQIADEIQRARGGGQPLESEISSHAAQKFGKGLENVRLHTDRKSDQISRQINARAFTVGNDIFFRSGAYSPNSEQGKQTLLHELTHVVQQSSSGTSSGPLKLGEPDDQFEREADYNAKSQSSSSQSGSAISKGVVQRSIFTSAKQKVGGLFGRGGNKASAQPNPAPPLSFTSSTLPKGLTQENWAQVQQSGVKNETEWNTYTEDKKVTILSLVTQNPELAKKLITAETNKQWPTDDKGKEIFDILIINTIDGTLKSTFEDWKKVSGPHKASLIGLSSQTFISELTKLASENKWPKDGDDKEITQKDIFEKILKFGIDLTKWYEIQSKDQRKFLLECTEEDIKTPLINLAISKKWPKDESNNDITDETVIKTITKTWGISLVQWNLITEADQRDFLLKNPNQKYTKELVRAAFRKLWPTDGTNKAILDDGTFTKIVDGIGIELWTWINIKSAGQRDFLLKSSGSLSKENLNELAKSAFSGVWPKDGTDNDISSAADWKNIKDSFTSMTPANWNGLDIQVRKDALAESDNTKRKNIINSANYQSKSKETKLEKAGGVASKPGFDLAAGVLGTTSGILSASKGTGDNAGLDRASGIVGATGDVLSMGTSATQFLGNTSKISRGKKMANDPNASLAMKALGRKEMSGGKWGAAQTGLGFFGSTASLGGNLTKSIDPESKDAKDTASGFGVASGFLGMFGSGLGLGKGGASMHSARKRSNQAKRFVTTAAAGQTLTADEQKMNEIAQFTAKNQNKTGKGFGIFKNVAGFLGSAVNTIGSIGSLAGLSNEPGFGLGVAGAALSGVGVLGGIGQWAAESNGKPKDTDLDAQAQKLIDLLNVGGPTGKKAAEFIQNVLKIDLVKADDPNTWTNWIKEDEAAAKALIKSKLSKF